MLTPLTDLLYPVECAGCGMLDHRLCPGCRAALLAPCAPPVVAPGHGDLLGDLPVACWAPYRASVARLVHAWKDGGRRDLTAPLAQALTRALAGLPVDADRPLCLVPVPSSRAAVRRRGEDVGLRLARAAAARSTAVRADERPGPVAPVRAVGLLCQARRVCDQAGLGIAQRRTNVQGAFAVRGRLRWPWPSAGEGVGADGEQVVVVDDVLTTGASAAEAVRVLRGRGLPVIGVATACHTPRRVTNSPYGGCQVGPALD